VVSRVIRENIGRERVRAIAGTPHKSCRFEALEQRRERAGIEKQAISQRFDAQVVVLPEDQRRHAAIGRDVKVLGQHNRIEIWDAERFSGVEGAKSADDVSAEIRRLRVF